MAIVNYAFARGIDYPSIVATSEKVAWTVDEIFGEWRFDTTKPIVPDSWVGTQHLAFLSEDERRTLNHLRAFSYVHLFGNYDEIHPHPPNGPSRAAGLAHGARTAAGFASLRRRGNETPTTVSEGRSSPGSIVRPSIR